MPLPAFSVTGNLNDIPGAVVSGELLTTALTPTLLRFTPNVKPTEFILWEGVLLRLEPVEVTVADDGSVSDITRPVLLLANDLGLNVTGLQWTVEIIVYDKVVTAWTFDAPVDGGTVDLASVAHAPNTPAVGLAVKGDPVDGVRRVADTLVFSVSGVDIGDPVDISDFIMPTNIVTNVMDHGANNTGASGDLGAIVTALATAMDAAVGGTIYVPEGNYRFTTTGTINSPKVSLQTAGASVVNFIPTGALGTSPCIDISNRASFNVDTAGRFGGWHINGAAVPSGVGMNYGDIIGGKLDDIRFSGYTSGIELQFINRTNWTERTELTRIIHGDGAVKRRYCVSGSGDKSFGYNRDLHCALNLDPVTATVTVASVTTTAGSTSATVASGGFPSVTTGMAVDGVGLWGGTTVAGVASNTLTLSIPAKASGTVTVKFAPKGQIGILVDAGAYVYHGTMHMIVNGVGGTEGTNISPILLQVQDGASYGLQTMDFAIQGESNSGKITAANVLATSGLTGFGYTDLPGFARGYVASSAAVRLGGAADWGFTNHNAPIATTHLVTDDNNYVLRYQRHGDSYDRLQVTPGPSIWLGGGAADVDTKLYRLAAGQLATDGRMFAQRFDVDSQGGPALNALLNAAGNYLLSAAVVADSQFRVVVQADGKLQWSAGSGSLDTSMERIFAGVLRTNGNIAKAVQVVSADTTLTCDKYASVLTGTTARAFTLPALSGFAGVELLLINRCTAAVNLTIQRAGADQIWSASAAVNSFTIAQGASSRVLNDGTYWVVTT